MAAAAPVDVLDPAAAALQNIGGPANLPMPVDPAGRRPATRDEDALLRQFEQGAPTDPNRPARPEEHAVLARFEGAPPPGADLNRPASPEEHALLKQFESTVPPPVIHHVAAPAPAAAAPESSPAPAPANARAARVAIDPKTGSVLDPLTGRPMQRGQPVEARAVPFTEAAINAVTPVLEGAKAVADAPFRVLSFLANPVHAALQQGLLGAGRAIGQHPGESDPQAWLDGISGFLQGVKQQGLTAAKGAVFSPDIKLSTPFSVPGIAERPIWGVKPGSVTDQWIRGLGNFGFNALVDELTGKAQGPMVGALLKMADRAGEITGLHDLPIPLPGGAKSINGIKAEWGRNRIIARAIAKHEGLQGPVQDAAIKATTAATKTYEGLAKMGVPLKGTNAAGRTINTLDDHVYHWIEAGTDGAAYKTRAQVEAEAAKLSVSPAAKKAIVQGVRDIGTAYAKAWQDVGRNLEKVGWLRPGTVDRMGGYYAARMYESTSHNPDDIGEWLKYAREIGKTDPTVGISADAYRDAEAIIGSAGERGGVANAAKGRKVPTWEERQERGAATQASPVFARSIRQQTRIAARQGALGEIAANPEIATPGTVETPVPPKYTARAYQDAKAAGDAAVARAAAARTEYQAAKTAAAVPSAGFDAVERLDKAKQEYTAALGAQRSARARLRSYRGMVETTPGATIPQNPAEYRTAADGAVTARHTEYTAAKQAYTDAVAAYKQAKTPENELAMLKARDGVRDGGIAWANAQNKLAEVEQEIATGRSGVTKTVVTAPPGSTRLLDRKYGPLSGMIVPNHVKEALDAYINPEPVDKGFLRLLAGWARFYKGQAMFLSFPALPHKVKYDSILAEGAAKDAGVAFTPAQVGRGVRALYDFRRSGKMTPAIEALSTETRAFVPRDDSLGKLGKSLQNVLGLGGRDVPAKTWAVWQKAGKLVPESIGEIERSYKIALTEALAPKLGYKAAAQKAAETIGDWTMTDPTLRVVERYGGVPFLTSRAKAFPKMLSIAAKHPEVLQRWGHPKLGASIAAAIGPTARAQAEIAPPGSIPVPGDRDEQGRQRFVTRDPTKVEPISDLWGLAGGTLGILGLARSALANVDYARSQREGKAQSITNPGELPPLDSDKARFDYVAARLQPGIARTVGRVALAAQGRTKFGGPYNEPETIVQAILGSLTGADVRTPKTELQTKQDAERNMTRAGRAMAYASGYLGELAAGTVKPRAFPGAEQSIRNAADAKAQLQAARSRLKSIADGQQFTGQQQIDELKKQSEWAFTVYHIGLARQAEEQRRNQVMAR